MTTLYFDGPIGFSTANGRGVATLALAGEFLKSIVDNEDGTYTVTFQNDANQEREVIVSAIDQTARDAADAAQVDIDNHEANHPGPDLSEYATDADLTAHDDASAAHGGIEAQAQTTEDGLEEHIAAHPGGVVSGPPGDGTVSRAKLTATLRADVDAHADQADLEAHESTTHVTSFADLAGMIADSQIPTAIMRDAEFTAAAVRTLLSLTSTEVNDLLTGASISSNVITFTQNDGTTATITLPAGGEGADGVVASGAFNDDQTELVLTLDTGGTVTIDVPAALHGGLRVIIADANGRLPAAADNLGSIGLAGNHFYRAVGEQGSDKVVTFKNYSATRVVEAGEPARSSDELLYAGSFANPPVGNYTLNAWAWDRGSEVWIRNLVHNGSSWVSSVGPPAYHHGNLYQTEGDAAVHVPDATYEGRVYIIGHGSSQRPKIVTGYTAPTAPSAEWIPIGLTIQDIADQIAAHDVAETGTHDSIRSLIAAVEDRLNAIDVRDILEIAAYADNATYSFGGSNSIVTHGDNILVYISSVERSADHDPSLHPNYWGNLSRLVTEIAVDNTSNVHFRRGMLIYTHEDEVYFCTTNAQAGTARGLTYVKENSGIGGEFINLTDKIPTTWKGPHIIGQDYKAGDRVTTNANSRIYTARVDTSETPPHADWIQVGPVGSGGGFTLRQGSTAPGNSLGDDGDWYLRTSNGQWYQKVSGAWVSRYTDMLGQAGSGITQTQGDARYALQSENLGDLDDAATARTNLGLGTAAVQPANAFLTIDTADARYLGEAQNLSDLPNAATARTNLGLGTAATQDTESVRGVKVVATALPAPSAVVDDDRVKLHVVQDSNNLVSEVAHLTHVEATIGVMTTGGTSADHGRRIGFDDDDYGHLTGFLNITKMDELPLGANAFRLEMHVASTGTIPRENATRSVYLRKRGASHWTVFHIASGLLGEYISNVNYHNRRLEEGAVYDVVVISNSQGSDGEQVENVHADDRYDFFPDGRDWRRMVDLDDFDSAQVLIEHVVGRRELPSGGTDGQVLAKASATDYDVAWEDAAAGGGSGTSVVAFGSALRGANYSSTVQSDTDGIGILNIADDDIEFEEGDFTITTAAGVSKVTVPEAGVYQINFSAEIGTTDATNNRRISAVGVVVVDRGGDGADIDYFYGSSSYFRGIDITETPTIAGSVLAELATDDEVTVNVVSDGQADPQNLTVYTARSHFGMARVSGDGSGSGGTPSDMQSGSPDSPASSVLKDSGADVPSGTWLLINFGTHSGFLQGNWFWVLASDLTGLPDAAVDDNISATNVMQLLITEEHYMWLGHTGGDPDSILYSPSSATVSPDAIRVMTM